MMPKKPITTADEETRKLYAQRLLGRYCEVVKAWPDDFIEIRPRPGAHLQLMCAADAGGARGVRIMFGPNKRPGKPRG
jgi:hypothetical protein